MPYATINDGRIMECFLSNYLSRGDTAMSALLHTYAGEVSTGQSTDPAALYDFLAVAADVLDKR